MPERAMTVRLSQQLEDVQTELSRKLSEAERIGDCLMELGARLQQEPWKWSIDWIEDAFPAPNSISPVEREIVAALDRNRVEWLLEDIRILKRRETELKRLAVA
jgi:transposase